MRLNKYIALHTAYSRRAADKLIAEGKVTINRRPAEPGSTVSEKDVISVEGHLLQTKPQRLVTIMMNKPTGYVCSRRGQGSKTIYELLPSELQNINSVGRLDKNSSGLLLLTNDGELANQLTHPRYQKIKVYEIDLDRPLQPLHQQMISDHGVMLSDGPSKLHIETMDDKKLHLRITMHEGRNRQIRRTLAALGYNITRLHRLQFGEYSLGDLRESKIVRV